MNNKRFSLVALLLAALLTVSGCGASPGATNGRPGQTAGPTGAATPPAGGTNAAGFAAAFQTVDRHPLDEAVRTVLWLAANAEGPDEPIASGGEALRQLADKYAAIVSSQGIHYVETSEALGMVLETEYWVKGGQFKKVELALGKATLFDGEYYIKYDIDEKKGTRFADSYAQAELTILTKGMIGSLAASPYQQQDDATVGGYDCSVFHMDMELLGMRGSTLYVDKQTGLLIKNQTGNPEDKGKSMAVVVERFEIGGFGDEVFAVPGDIALDDY